MDDGGVCGAGRRTPRHDDGGSGGFSKEHYANICASTAPLPQKNYTLDQNIFLKSHFKKNISTARDERRYEKYRKNILE